MSMRSSEKNRFQNAFTVCNLTLDAVVSDMFGVSATAIEDYLLDTDDVDPNYCVYLLRVSLKKKASDVAEAVKGFNMTAEQKERVRIMQMQEISSVVGADTLYTPPSASVPFDFDG